MNPKLGFIREDVEQGEKILVPFIPAHQLHDPSYIWKRIVYFEFEDLGHDG